MIVLIIISFSEFALQVLCVDCIRFEHMQDWRDHGHADWPAVCLLEARPRLHHGPRGDPRGRHGHRLPRDHGPGPAPDRGGGSQVRERDKPRVPRRSCSRTLFPIIWPILSLSQEI